MLESRTTPTSAPVADNASAPAGGSGPGTPYGTLPPASMPASRKPISLPRLREMHAQGEKITMLPHAAVVHATLAEGRICPTVSFYATFSTGTFALTNTRSVIERVHIEKNLRIGDLETYFDESAIINGVADGVFGEELILLHKVAKAVGARRG